MTTPHPNGRTSIARRETTHTEIPISTHCANKTGYANGKTRKRGAKPAITGEKWSPSTLNPGALTSTIGICPAAYDFTACSKIALSHDTTAKRWNRTTLSNAYRPVTINATPAGTHRRNITADGTIASALESRHHARRSPLNGSKNMTLSAGA